MNVIDSHLDFYDYHHYNHMHVSATNFLLPDWNISKPCMIGECGLGGHFQREFWAMRFDTAFRDLPIPIGLLDSGSLASDVSLRELFDAQAECISNIMRRSYEHGYAGCLVWEYAKQYTDRRRPSSPYNPRGLYESADWEDRFPMIWTPARSWNADRFHSAATRNPRDPQYMVPLLADGSITGRKVVRVMNDIFLEHLNQGRCPPL